MVNKEQIEIIKKGPEAWNAWRSWKRLAPVDLSEADLGGAFLSKANLSKANLSRANLTKANLSKANLTWSDLSEAMLFKADLSAANLSEANLVQASLIMAYLDNAILSKTKLYMANALEASFIGAQLGGAKLDGADLSGTNFRGGNFREASLLGVTLDNANLGNTILEGAYCQKASVVRSNLSGANISGADIADINISGWVIKGIKCTHVFIHGKRIDYGEGEFEKRFTEMKKIVEIIISAPLSDMTHYTGRIIEGAINQKHGEGALILTEQKALSNNDTKLGFTSFQEQDKLESIKAALSEMKDKVNAIFEEHKARQDDKDIIKIKDRVGLGPTPFELDTKAVQNVIAERFVKISPVLQQIIFAIQSSVR